MNTNIGVNNESGEVGVEDRASGAGEDESTDESAGLSAGLWVAIILGGLVVAGCIVFFVFFAVYRRRRKGGPKHAISMAGDVEMSTKLRRRQESESRYWVPPPPLPSGDPKPLKSIQQRQWQKKAEGRTHRSRLVVGSKRFAT